MYSDSPLLLEYLKDQKNIGQIEFATNGTIIPGNEILDMFTKDKRISVRISDYRVSENSEKLKKMLDEYGIKSSYYRFAGNKGEWRNLGAIDISPVNDYEKEEHFKTCSFRTCLTLENWEITYCSRATNAYRLQKFERNEHDFFRLDKTKNIKKALKKFIRNPKPMEACRYCNGTKKGDAIIPALQME